jgi:hypothetical protein
MFGEAFFFITIIVGTLLFSAGGLAGLQRKRMSRAEIAGLRLLLELSLGVVVLALVPDVLFFFFTLPGIVWRLASFAIAMFLLVEVGRVIEKTRALGAHWPVTMIFLLVLSGIMLTIELINMLWWSSLAGYTAGLLWILTLAGIQFIAFVCYDPVAPKRYSIQSVVSADSHYRQLQRNHRSDRANGPPFRHTDRDSQAIGDHRSQHHTHRLAFTRTRNGYGRTVANPTIRSHTDTGQRRNGHTGAESQRTPH